MLRRALYAVIAAALLFAAPAKAQQNQPVFATGTLTPGHALVLQQAGTPGSAVTRDGGPAIAGNFTEIGITNDGLPLCVRDKAGLHLLCFGANALGGGLISYNPVGGGAPLSLSFNVNGVNYPFPGGGGGGGNVVGPTSPTPTPNDIVVWNGGLGVRDAPQFNLFPVSAVEQFACKGDGTTDNAACFSSILAQTSPQIVYFAAGTYRISCGHVFSTTSAISFIGAGRGKTIIQLPPGCAEADTLFTWTNTTFTLSGFTLDMNNSTFPESKTAIQGLSNAGTVTGPIIRDIAVINAARPGRLISMNTTGGGAYVNIVIDNNYLAYTAAAITTDNCVAFGGIGNSNDPGAAIHGFSVTKNTCVNTSMQIDGDSGVVAENDISGFAFGAGIFTVFNGVATTPPPPGSDHDNIIANNVIHDSVAGYDSNDTATAGIENNCYRCLIIGNIIHDNGGEGIRNYGKYTKISGNKIFNNGKITAIHGNYIPAGIALDNGNRSTYFPIGITLEGNDIYDDGANTQAFGLVFNPGNGAPSPQGLFPISSNNNISGVPSLTFTILGVPTAGTAIFDTEPPTLSLSSGFLMQDWVMIGSQAVNLGATPVAAFTFFPIDTASLHHFRLECADIITSANVQVGLQVATGPTPTWQTASYGVQQIYTGATLGVLHYDDTATGAIYIGPFGVDTAGTWPLNFTASTGDMFIARGRKLWSIFGASTTSGANNPITVTGVGWWDTAQALTAIRVLPVSGNITNGFCSLYGRH